MPKVITFVLTNLRGYDIHNLMMTNVIDPIEMTSAASAGSCGEVARDDLFGLNEYDVFDERGEPLGDGYGLSHREAAEWWAVENGTSAFIQVQRGTQSRTYFVDLGSDGSVSARECAE